MKYPEYMESSKKHLKACLNLIESYGAFEDRNPQLDDSVWLELYYLSGYIVEGVTVYLAYKFGNWPESDDIITNPPSQSFLNTMDLDFFPNRKDPTTHQPMNLGNNLSIHQHNFQSIIKQKLRSIPAYDNIPYIGTNSPIDPEVEQLIDDWKPGIRYSYPSQRTLTTPILTWEKMRKLVVTCENIFLSANNQ